MKYGNLNLGQIEAVINKLGGMDGLSKFLRGELIVSEPVRNWREENGVIYFSVTSDGATGKEWATRLEKKGFLVGSCAESVFCSTDFKSTSGVTYEMAVLKGMLFNDSDRITENICKEAKNRRFSNPSAEVACLIREKFSDKEFEAMGLHWVVAMHEPIKDSDGDPRLLGAYYYGNGSWLGTDYGSPDIFWLRNNGFAFVIS